MTKRAVALRALADKYAGELLYQDEAIKPYVNEVSLVLKGSASRGNCDRYSDIDLVFFTNRNAYDLIVNGYYKQGKTQRKDGFFIILPQEIGHYHIEKIELLEEHMREAEVPLIWEYSNAIALHDPNGAFTAAVELGRQQLDKQLPDKIKRLYLDAWLTLDWMRQPLLRGDRVSASLHGAKVLSDICRICYLIDRKPYPHDKWLIHYLGTTLLGKRLHPKIDDYCTLLGAEVMPKHLDLMAYPLFSNGLDMIDAAAKSIRRRFGDQPWLTEWYKFV